MKGQKIQLQPEAKQEQLEQARILAEDIGFDWEDRVSGEAMTLSELVRMYQLFAKQLLEYQTLLLQEIHSMQSSVRKMEAVDEGFLY